MSTDKWICFLLCTGILAREDLRTRHISLMTASAGALCGALITGAEIITGTEEAGAVLQHLTALLWGLGLLLLSRLSRGAIGKGDGLCFCSFACWWNAAELFTLLLVSLVLSGTGGAVLLFLKKRSLKGSVPFLPFVFAAALILFILSLCAGA